jgi:hypothetical protein
VLLLTGRRIAGCSDVRLVKDLETPDWKKYPMYSLQLIGTQDILTGYSGTPDEQTFESNFGHQCLSR